MISMREDVIINKIKLEVGSALRRNAIYKNDNQGKLYQCYAQLLRDDDKALDTICNNRNLLTKTLIEALELSVLEDDDTKDSRKIVDCLLLLKVLRKLDKNANAFDIYERCKKRAINTEHFIVLVYNELDGLEVI